MEQQLIAIKRLPLEDAQQRVLGARGDHGLAEALRRELAALLEHPGDALEITLPPETRYPTMKARVQRLATRLGLTITIRKTPEGMVVWQETDEERQERLARAARRGTHTNP